MSGTLTSANILAVPGQNIPVHDFNVLLAALGSDTTYVNVHTALPGGFPSGEIRGQVRHADNDDEDGKDRDRH